MADLKVPVICTIIGEAGSGGALAIGVGDRVLMLEYGIYSVISPEGCASILWKSAEKAADAANAMGITAKQIIEMGIIDEIIDEPLGGAHRDIEMMAANLKQILIERLKEVSAMPTQQLTEKRYQKLMSIGACQ